MQSPETASPAQTRQTRQQFVNPEDYLSYELGKAVRELPPLYTRLLAGSISVLVAGTIGWAYFSKVDEVAVTHGQLIPATQIRPVQALEGGVIRSIYVKEGEQVKQGQVLIEQDPKLSGAEVDRLKQNVNLIRQEIARLDAERMGKTQSGSALQDQLLAARLQEFDTKAAAAQAEAQRQLAVIGEAKARLAKLQENLGNARATLKNAAEREQSLRAFVNSVVPRLDYLNAKDQLTSAQDQVSSIENEMTAQEQSIQQAEQAYQVAVQSADQLGAQRQSEILTQLAQRRENLADIEGQLRQAQIREEGQTITAPISGKIYNIQISKAERTIEPGEELLSILPDGQTLVLEVKVLNRDIGFIHEGQRAKIKIDTFPFQEFGTINGEVIKLSPNSTIDKDLGPVFTAQVKLDRTQINAQGKDVQLVPGMSATAEIVTRQRSVLTFILEPITRRFSEAFSTR